MEFLNTTVYTDKKKRNGSYAGTLAESIKNPTKSKHSLKIRKDETNKRNYTQIQEL